MKFIAIRHGQSEYNIKGLCNDKIEKQVPLTELGKQQALEVGQHLKDEPLTHIICSPLLRTRQTAELINQSLQLPIVIEENLIDIRTGYDSQPVADYLAFIESAPTLRKVEGFESLSDHFVRVNQVLDGLQASREENFLLVVHEETLRVCRAWSEKLDLEAVIGLAFENCRPYFFEPRFI